MIETLNINVFRHVRGPLLTPRPQRGRVPAAQLQLPGGVPEGRRAGARHRGGKAYEYALDASDL